MRELGRLCAERLKDEDVLEGIGQVILAPDDWLMRRSASSAQEARWYGWHSIGTQQREVFHFVGEF